MKLSCLSTATAAAALLFANAENCHASTSRTTAETKFQMARLVAEVQRRSNPTGSYTPSYEACPAITNTANNGSNLGFIRDTRNFAISANETDYITRHRTAVQGAWATWLSSSPGPNLNGTDGISGGVTNYTNTLANLPKVGLAVSGGGYRAMVSGGSVEK
jgi:lysophospholipase